MSSAKKVVQQQGLFPPTGNITEQKFEIQFTSTVTVSYYGVSLSVQDIRGSFQNLELRPTMRIYGNSSTAKKTKSSRCRTRQRLLFRLVSFPHDLKQVQAPAQSLVSLMLNMRD
jgi:hypothetical protein